MNKSKKVLVAMGIVVVLLIIIIIILLINNTKNEQQNTDIIGGGTYGDKETQTDKELVGNTTVFFTVENCINDYVSYIQEQDNKAIYNLLDENYVKNNKININNVKDYIENFNSNEMFIATKMYEQRKENINTYIVEGLKDDSEYNTNLYYIVEFDINKSTYNITPLFANNYKNLDDINVETEAYTIKENENNVFKYYRISNEAVAEKYLNYYTKLARQNPEKAFSLIDENYRKERFKDFETYKNYSNRMSNKYDNLNIVGDSYEVLSDSTKYILKDSENEVYTIVAKEIMNFSIQLDDYTIETDEFKKLYLSATNEAKAVTNAEKFMKMVNAKDYETAYQLLDDTYRANVFPTFDLYEQSLEASFFDNNYYSITDISEQGSYYIVTLDLKDRISSAANTKQIKIIIGLQDGTNFKMSFAN